MTTKIRKAVIKKGENLQEITHLTHIQRIVLHPLGKIYFKIR